ncbi:Ionotropic receptor 41a11 [Blattella germanica]|nr:Ionotropic receptor 41a11 [Blattella germanica]
MRWMRFLKKQEMIINISILMIFVSVKGFDITDKINRILGVMSRDVVMKYFTESRCLGLVTEDSDKIVEFILPLNLPIHHVHISLEMVKSSEQLDTEFEGYVWEERLLQPINDGCLAFIVQTSELRSMMRAFPRLFHSPKSVYRANRKYLFLPIGNELNTSDSFEETIVDVFSMREMDFMPDVVIAKLLVDYNTSDFTARKLKSFGGFSPLLFFTDISPDDEEDVCVELITQRFVGETTKSDRVSLDIWDPKIGFRYGTNLYPDKISNLMGKKLSVTGIAYEPLTVIDWEAEPSTYDGLDLQFMFQFAKKLNFTFEYVHDEYYYGEIWPNGSGNGALGLTAMDIADYVFCGTCIWEYEHRFVDFSTSYFQTTVVLVTPKPKLLPGWMVPVLPFNYNMWTAVAVSVLICTSLLYFTSSASVRFLARGTGANMVNMYSSWIECAFRTTGLLVLQVPPDERDWSTPRFVPMRHLVTWLILFYFVVTTAYSGGLATVLTVPRYEKPIETVSDLARHNVKWTGIYDAYLVSIKDSVNPDIQKVVKNWRFGDYDWLEAKTKTGDMSFALEKMLGGHFFIPPFIQEETMDFLRIMKEDLYSCTCVYVMRKGSPFMKSLNTLLMRARDAGLYYYWESYVVRTHLNSRRQLSVINSRIQNDAGPTKLQLHHIVGAFYLLAYGLMLGSTVFILENLYLKFITVIDTSKLFVPKSNAKNLIKNISSYNKQNIYNK